eukprot:364950-Chlamydomonas_euryale.AAC.11
MARRWPASSWPAAPLRGLPAQEGCFDARHERANRHRRHLQERCLARSEWGRGGGLQRQARGVSPARRVSFSLGAGNEFVQQQAGHKHAQAWRDDALPPFPLGVRPRLVSRLPPLVSHGPLAQVHPGAGDGERGGLRLAKGTGGRGKWIGTRGSLGPCPCRRHAAGSSLG